MKVYFAPLECGETAARAVELVSHAASLGFDTIGSTSSLTDGIATQEGTSGVEAASTRVDAAIRQLAKACRNHRLALMLDLALDRAEASEFLFRRHPDWFAASEFDAPHPPDPRFIADRKRLPAVRYESRETAEAFLGWWQERLCSLAEEGVMRFRCLSATSTPPSIWQHLIASVRAEHPSCSFYAWTPGQSWDDIAALAGLGFAGGFSSCAWWDGRAPWLIGECELLTRVGPTVVAFPVPPPGERLAPAQVYSSPMQRPDEVRAASNHALRIAAAIGNGLLMPMGFEYGANPSIGWLQDISELRRRSPIDLSNDVRAANAMIDRVAASGLTAVRPLDGYAAPVTAFFRMNALEPSRAKEGSVVLINTDTKRAFDAPLRLAPLPPAAGEAWSIAEANETIRPALGPGEVRVMRARRNPPMAARAAALPSVDAAIDAPRIAIENLSPSVDGGLFPAKRVVGEPIEVEADIFADGHDVIAAELLWRAADELEWRRAKMVLVNNDRWRAVVAPERIGRYLITVEAWSDAFGSVLRDLEKKRAAGADASIEIAEARLLVEGAAGRTTDPFERATMSKLLDCLADPNIEVDIEMLLSADLRELMTTLDERRFLASCDRANPIDVERPKAAFASWYELFPRSITDDQGRHGTFADVIGRLPAIRAMGFDVLYFPPIHPIGTTNRKGRNNAPRAAAGDLGSPYAIGAAEGGHKAIHPALGTPEDFRRLIASAAEQGIEIALDFAIQCSPDHPWLRQHPGWYSWRPDGSIRYAENPPKKYEDIVNVDFYAKKALPDLWIALRDVVLHWVDEGVKLFRVDNPHTKPLPFWQWLIADVRTRHPDVIFLSEAFTRPKIMYRLAKVGFSQSYTYFTWRNTKSEITEYLTELTRSDVKEHFRPHFFVNTPDINPLFLQKSGRPGFVIRAALAATLSGLWGVYSGFELCESAALPGREEYLDSEKYEIRVRDTTTPGNIVGEISILNRLRRTYPALQTHLRLTFYTAFNDAILYYGKGDPESGELILVAVSLDPYQPQEATIEIPLWEWGLGDNDSLSVEDLVHGNRFVWTGKLQKLRLDPFDLPFAIWRVAPLTRGT